MSHRARTYLVLSLIAGASQIAGCALTEDPSPEATPTLAAEEPAEGLSCIGEPDPATSCPDGPTGSVASPEESEHSFSGADWYFHPNNGAHGGWIESWRLCSEGGQNVRICTGGYAPVRYWNPSSCGGTIQDYYPQGWSGWSQTGGMCG